MFYAYGIASIRTLEQTPFSVVSMAMGLTTCDFIYEFQVVHCLQSSCPQPGYLNIKNSTTL
jgi:hypothetical protein